MLGSPWLMCGILSFKACAILSIGDPIVNYTVSSDVSGNCAYIAKHISESIWSSPCNYEYHVICEKGSVPGMNTEFDLKSSAKLTNEKNL